MKRPFVILFILSSFAAVAYNNCAPHQAEDDSASSLSATGTCEGDLKAIYDSGYHQFLSQTCKNCHISGPGKGAFASPDLDTSYNAFNQMGFEKISTYAVSDTHNPPYTGSQNQQTVFSLKLQWQTALNETASCANAPKQSSDVDLNSLYETTPKLIAATTDGKLKKITWDMMTELTPPSGLSLPALTNAQFNINVSIFTTSSGQTAYTVTKPSISGSAVDVHVKGIYIKINNQIIQYDTTFSYVDTAVRAGSDEITGLISSGSLVVAGVINAADKISVGFVGLDVVTLPPPAIVQFAATQRLAAPQGGGDLLVDVTMSPANPNQAITLGLSVDNSAICPSTITCSADDKLLIRPNPLLSGNINRFDWDYRISSMAVTFLPGETRKSVKITFSDDIRKEQDKLLTLKLGTAPGAKIGTTSSVQIKITKSTNPTPDPTIPTFSQLMNSSTGVLGKNCVSCHNSRDRKGDYDMTSYDELIAKKIVVPNDATSLLYYRMDPTATKPTGVGPMPQGGYLTDTTQIQQVLTWIQNGALNN